MIGDAVISEGHVVSGQIVVCLAGPLTSVRRVISVSQVIDWWCSGGHSLPFSVPVYILQDMDSAGPSLVNQKEEKPHGGTKPCF